VAAFCQGLSNPLSFLSLSLFVCGVWSRQSNYCDLCWAPKEVEEEEEEDEDDDDDDEQEEEEEIRLCWFYSLGQ